MARKKNFAIIGISNFTLSVIYKLIEKKQNITVFDYDESRLSLHLSEFNDDIEGIVLDSTNKAALEKNSIQSYNYVIIGIGNNIESSLVTILNLLDLNCHNILVRAKDDNHKRILMALGLNESQIIIPDKIAGTMSAIRSLFEIDFDVEIQSIDEDYISTVLEVKNPELFDKTIHESELSTNKEFNIIQIKRKNKIMLPDDYTELKEDDILLVYAKTNKINFLAEKIQLKQENNDN